MNTPRTTAARPMEKENPYPLDIDALILSCDDEDRAAARRLVRRIDKLREERRTSASATLAAAPTTLAAASVSSGNGSTVEEEDGEEEGMDAVPPVAQEAEAVTPFHYLWVWVKETVEIVMNKYYE